MKPVRMNQGDGPGQIFYYNQSLAREASSPEDMNKVFFVIAPEQLRTPCGSNSCVSP
jgi:hypothetical protein